MIGRKKEVSALRMYSVEQREFICNTIATYRHAMGGGGGSF